MVRLNCWALVCGSLALTACAYVGKDNLPSIEVQPTAKPLPTHLTEAVEAHARWLQAKRPHSEADPDRDRRALLRLRMPNPVDELDAQRVSAANHALSQYYLTNESRLYRSGKQRPGLCLALSGGGIRSSAFAIGVLQGLNETGKLREIDIISGVSGGAYAAAWYTDHRTRVGDDDRVLSDAYVGGSIDPALFSFPVAVLGATTVILNPLTAGSGSANGVDSGTLNNSYSAMVSSAFSIPFFGPATMGHLREAVIGKRIPLPIVGIAAYPLPDRLGEFGSPDDPLTAFAKSVALNDSYLEVTPFRYGINGFGFQNRRLVPLSDDLWSYVLYSGAAYDRPHESGSIGRLTGGMRLGGTMSLIVPKRHPEPAGSISVDDVSRHFFYASDGGFVENLAAFPLTTRRCEFIVIADAEYDPEWVFEGYRVLRDRLSAEHGLKLVVPGIEEHIASNPASNFEVKRRADGLDLPSSKAECARATQVTRCRARAVSTNIFYGQIPAFPLEAQTSARPTMTNVAYLKLGLPEDVVFQDRSPIKLHFSDCMRTPESCHFPQDPTFNKSEPTKSQIYTKAQFNAYKELGREMSRRIVWRNRDGQSDPSSNE
jgi:hypothetical protein